MNRNNQLGLDGASRSGIRWSRHTTSIARIIKLHSLAALINAAALIETAAAQQSPSPAETASASRTAGGGIEELVVTAQRRIEPIQKSSVSIEVMSDKELSRRGITEVRDLTAAAPSITISQNGAYVQTNIRGVGDFTNSALQQTAVSYSVDGAVVGQVNGISQNFYDLERVEILKGPQGTLYGRNATGGAVNIITKRPTQEFEGYLTAEYGNYDSKRLTGAVNLPVTGTLAMRGAFNVVDRDGYLSDGTDDAVTQAGRLQAYWQPTESINLKVAGSYAHTGGNGAGATLAPRQPGTDLWDAAGHPLNNAAIAAGTFGFQTPFLTDSDVDIDQWDLAAEANIALGDFATLTLIPVYRSLEMHQRTNTIGFVGEFHPQRSEQLSIEARLGNQAEKLKWTLGAFFYDEKSREVITSLPLAEPNFIPLFNVESNIHSKVESYAAFGEANYSLTDRLRVIGGVRYTHDPISFRGSYTDLAVIPDPGSPFPQSGKREFNSTTWKTGLEFDLRRESMAYITASTGYKAGGFFYSPDPTDFSYKPEKLTAFDAGIRNRFLDNTLQVNLEAFYWRYRDQQVTNVNYTTGGFIAYLTRNAGSADPRGGALDVVYKPTENDTLSFNVGYTRAKYKEFAIDYPAALIDFLRAGPRCSVPAAPTVNASGLPVFTIDCSGAPLPRAPEWAGTVGYERNFQLSGSGSLALNLGATWSTSRYITADFYVPESHDEGYVLADASLTYTSPNDAWSFTVFGKNLTDEAVYQGGFADALNGFGGPDSPTFFTRTIGAPRTYGARVNVNFGK